MPSVCGRGDCREDVGCRGVCIVSFEGSVDRPAPSRTTTPHTATCSCRIRRLRRIPMLHERVDASLHCKRIAAGSPTAAGCDDAAWTRSSASTVPRVAAAVCQPRAFNEQSEEEEGAVQTRTGRAGGPWGGKRGGSIPCVQEQELPRRQPSRDNGNFLLDHRSLILQLSQQPLLQPRPAISTGWWGGRRSTRSSC